MNRSGQLSLLAPVILLPMLAGCFGGSAPVRSEAQIQADKSLSRGIRAGQKGDLPASEAFLLQSLATSSSIEDRAAETLALINLSRLYRLQHDPERAGSYADRAVAAAGQATGLSAEAAYEKSLVELSTGKPDSALQWAQRSIAAEREDSRLGSRLNLAARIQTVRGAWGEAQGLAEAALKANRSAGQAEEEANSLRLLGSVARHGRRYEAGAKLLEEALMIDRRIGQSGKIALDLEELAATAADSGRPKDAAGFMERAVAVHVAAGRLDRARADLLALADLYAAQGEPIKAEQARAEARKFTPPAGDQPSGSSSTTTSPSSRP